MSCGRPDRLSKTTSTFPPFPLFRHHAGITFPRCHHQGGPCSSRASVLSNCDLITLCSSHSDCCYKYICFEDAMFESTSNNPFNRIVQFNKHITVSPKLSANMSSQTNNDQFQISKLFDVKGKVALVTGGGSGIGLMIVQARSQRC